MIFAMIKITGIPKKLSSNMVSGFNDNALTLLTINKNTTFDL
jgi:hypothetical protein